MRYLPDTNILIAALNGESTVKTAFNNLAPEDEVLLSVVVWSERGYGALCSAKKKWCVELANGFRRQLYYRGSCC